MYVGIGRKRRGVYLKNYFKVVIVLERNFQIIQCESESPIEYVNQIIIPIFCQGFLKDY